MPRSLLSLFPCAEHSAITQPLFAPALSWVWFKADVWWVLCIGKISIELPSHSALKGINENPPQLNIPGSSKEIRVFPKKKSACPALQMCLDVQTWGFGMDPLGMKRSWSKKWPNGTQITIFWVVSWFIWHWWGCSFSGPARELSVRCVLINLDQVPGTWCSPAIPAWGHQHDWFRWSLAEITGFLFPGAGVAGGSCQCFLSNCWSDQLKY